ncbi:spoIIIJ-associated protein [Thermanaeromonas toyohensis ToBE]|uniref:RNA-binding protein KhpB n=1 Tax=Thermanaeromonas toyohensis ToBE TaxID=698762 RepID=A0A1W1W3W1_9FIRM|nr:RNA-binding cell elongation regulator Jag/EloR [Thermanaeromonas toyohensis]SMC00193.1 spoIIIJ-associated protein [Thermanaeromonas toyohensis ToBE]
MKAVEMTGRTVQEAVEAALQVLGARREEVEVEVLEEGSKGFLGLLGSRQAKVRVSLLENPEKVIKEFLEKVLKAMALKAGVEIRRREDYFLVSFHGRELGLLIGRRGETLNALQYLTNLAVSRLIGQRVRIVLDAEGYRKRREQALVRLARRLSEKVKRTGNKVVLEPMTAQERRIIHTALQNDAQVITYSEGEEPHRKVVISLRKG